MRIAKSILVCVCLLGLAQPVWSQKPNETANGSLLRIDKEDL
jgi:hypothetical protein